MTSMNIAGRCSINSLPDELLLDVSVLYITQDDNTNTDTTTPSQRVLKIAAVSLRFRRLIQSFPVIWAKAFDINAPRNCVKKFLKHSGTKLLLSNIQPLPLSCRPQDIDTVAWQWDMILNGRHPLVERCQALELSAYQCMWNTIHTVMSGKDISKISSLTIAFPSHHCHINNEDKFNSPFAKGTLYPRLSTLSLRDGSFALPVGSFPALTALSVQLSQPADINRNSLMTAVKWIDFLKSVPQLQELRLKMALAPLDEVFIPATTTILTLSKLQVLDICDWHHNRLGHLLKNLRVPTMCDINITTGVYTSDGQGFQANGGDPDYIGGLIHFLQARYSGEDAAPFGPSLCLFALKGERRKSVAFRLFNYGDSKTIPCKRQEHEGVPRFELDIRVMCAPNDTITADHPLFNSIHEQVATTGLARPFSSISHLLISSNDELFAESSAQQSFFQSFPYVNRLDLLNVSSLLHVRAIMENAHVQQGLFPKLHTLKLVKINFQRVWDRLIGVYDFSDPIGNLLVLLRTRVFKSGNVVPQIAQAELINCDKVRELRSELGRLGIETAVSKY